MVRKWWMSKWFSTSMWVGYCLWEETPVRCDRWLGGWSHYIPLPIGFQPSKVHDFFRTHTLYLKLSDRRWWFFLIFIILSIEMPDLTHTQINHRTYGGIIHRLCLAKGDYNHFMGIFRGYSHWSSIKYIAFLKLANGPCILGGQTCISSLQKFNLVMEKHLQMDYWALRRIIPLSGQ